MSPDEFVTVVTENYKKHTGVFLEHKNAEDLAPNTDDASKALFIFYVIQLDYATKSQNLYHGAKNLFLDKLDFFSPKCILGMSDTDLSKTITEYLHPRYINEAVYRYRVNSETLQKYFNSDPREIFNKARSIKEVELNVRKFRGFGPKIGNFFIRTMINTFTYEYEDIESMLPPVDIHDVRIAYIMGFIDSSQMTTANILKTKRLWNGACVKADVSWLEFDKALWLLGSMGKPKNIGDINRLLCIE